MSETHDRPGLRACLLLLALVSRLVPRAARGAWRQEWEAEVRAAWRRLARRNGGWRGSWGLLRQTSGSIRDAAWMRRQFSADADLIHDWRHGLRMLRRSPGHAVVTILVFALGIGTTTAVVSIADALLLRPLPYRDADRVVTLWQTKPSAGVDRDEVAPANFLDWRQRATVFESIAAFEPYSFDYSAAGRPEDLFAGLVTEGFFDALGVGALHGRTFLPQEHAPGAARVAVVGHGFWQRRLGGDPTWVGRPLVLDDVAYTIVGVLPPDFRPKMDMDGERAVWAPRPPRPGDPQTRGSAWLTVVARLEPGATVGRATSEMAVIAERLGVEYPATNSGTGIAVVPLRDHLVGSLRPALWLLIAASAFVLLIACANVASLLLARGVERERELALRAAIGAGRGRLIRQLLAESVLLSLLGCAGGLLVAWFTRLAMVTVGPWQWGEMPDVPFGLRAWLVAAGTTVVAAFAAGAAPALQLSGRRIGQPLGPGERATAGRARLALRHGLVVIEIACALVLLCGAGLLVRSFIRLVDVDPGFVRQNVLALQVFISDRQRTPERRVRFVEEALASLETLPGVRSAGAASLMPFGVADLNIRGSFTIEGRPKPAPADAPTTAVSIATPGYFPTLGVRLVRGRLLEPSDDGKAPRVALVSQALAQRFWPGADPIGSRLSLRWLGRDLAVEVVGIVGDLRHEGLDRAARPTLFLPHAQSPFGGMTFVVRTAGDPALVLDAAKQRIWAIDPLQTIYSASTVQAWIDRTLGERRFSMLLVSAFAGMALSLALVGLYGVMSFVTRQRAREIGVRRVLGAKPADILRLVLGRGLRLTLGGILLGLVGALAAGRLMQDLLFGVSPADAMSFGGVTVLIAVVSLAACLVPALRALRVDPASAMREE
jgi:putative ABC transport system permease protein